MFDNVGNVVGSTDLMQTREFFPGFGLHSLSNFPLTHH